MGKAIIRKPKVDKPRKGRKKKSIQEVAAEIKTKSLSIKSLIENSRIQTLKEIEPLFTKSMADQLGVNHGRFIDKLKNPIKFSTKDIFRFAYYVDLNPTEIINQVKDEIENNQLLVEKLKKFKAITKRK
ncbi:MAG: hypothetical protein EPN39_12215 [Chitinophagaceae bacterium]|nr:MAG: hypothetical protein EPN39_12215 [Chitinophagaceae bacterium]